MSKYKLIAEAFAFNKLRDVELPTNSLTSRRLKIEEIKNLIREEFKDAKEVADTKAKEAHWGTSDVELEKQIDWVKALDLEEAFNFKK